MIAAEHLGRRPANFQPLTPLDLFDRAVAAWPERPAITWRGETWTYRAFGAIVGRFAQHLLAAGVKPGEVVSIVSANRPEMLAAHFAVPLVGAVLNTINTRLGAAEAAYIVEHSGAEVLIVDPPHRPHGRAIAERSGVRLSTFAHGAGEPDDEAVPRLLAGPVPPPVDHRCFVTDEWQPICVNYTSGTTGHPKGVVYTHRGAYLNALGNVLALGFDHRSVYLWVLPMFHCNGWCHPWAVTAAGGLHVCIDRADPAAIFEAIDQFGVTHIACAPVVLYMLANSGRTQRESSRRIRVATGGAAPTPTLIAEMDGLGFDLVHLYGLTESYGPATLQVLDDTQMVLDPLARAALLARQGRRHMTAGGVGVVASDGAEVAWDGQAMGEITLRGNTLMAGYHLDARATEDAFRGGVFHTGDLAVRHPGGEIEIRDRAKDIVISGGENISSLEIEKALHRHPAVLMAAVVAQPDPKWGEIPCAFIEVKPGATVGEDELRQFCRGEMAAFKAPRRFIFGELPKTATGKIQKYLLRQRVRDEGGGA